MTSLAEIVSDHLGKFGVCVIDDFIGECHGEALLEEVKELHEKTEFKVNQENAELKNENNLRKL